VLAAIFAPATTYNLLPGRARGDHGAIIITGDASGTIRWGACDPCRLGAERMAQC